MAINFLNTVAVDDNVLFVDTINDRVGIGTASPSYKFTAYGNSADSEIVASFGSANDQNEYTAIGLSGFTASNGATKAGLALKRTATYGSGELHFLNNNTLDNSDMTLSDSKMMINSSGNVGIGTASPSRQLTLSGNSSPIISLASNTTGGEPSIYFGDTADDNAGRIVYSNSQDAMQIWTAAAQRMRITSDGNVGIGTTSPTEKLDVNGNVKIKDALLSNQENTDIDTGAEVVAQVAHATYTAAFFDFVVKKGTNVRSGTVYACHNGDTTPLVEFTETSTNDLGDTSDVTLSVDISGTNMRLLATVTSDDWSIKSLIRAI